MMIFLDSIITDNKPQKFSWDHKYISKNKKTKSVIKSFSMYAFPFAVYSKNDVSEKCVCECVCVLMCKVVVVGSSRRMKNKAKEKREDATKQGRRDKGTKVAEREIREKEG